MFNNLNIKCISIFWTLWFPSVTFHLYIGARYSVFCLVVIMVSALVKVSLCWSLKRGVLPTDVSHDDVIKWKHFPRYWPFVQEIHRSSMNSPHKGQWRGALMFSLICTWINRWVNSREADDLRRYRAHYDVIVMTGNFPVKWPPWGK